MPKFKKLAVEVEASQWFKNGDHPLDYIGDVDGYDKGRPKTFSAEFRKANDWSGGVVKRFRHPYIRGTHVCAKCGHTMHVHGWIDQDSEGITVCPGNWVVTELDGRYSVVNDSLFRQTHEEVTE